MYLLKSSYTNGCRQQNVQSIFIVSSRIRSKVSLLNIRFLSSVKCHLILKILIGCSLVGLTLNECCAEVHRNT